ncbi:hypothetical protein GQ53DRAFT_110783 [Thozetella sp. PMI_491]|nr:hypothetical protein GQ53DRAFT_110783 [Thozetella sp. PMI_491]
MRGQVSKTRPAQLKSKSNLTSRCYPYPQLQTGSPRSRSAPGSKTTHTIAALDLTRIFLFCSAVGSLLPQFSASSIGRQPEERARIEPSPPSTAPSPSSLKGELPQSTTTPLLGLPAIISTCCWPTKEGELLRTHKRPAIHARASRGSASPQRRPESSSRTDSSPFGDPSPPLWSPRVRSD